jgi:radical SAM protein with 4Fe4S-binding SPASM domain
MADLVFPKFFTFQWHITERCNWHCKHCYQSENPVLDLSLEKLFFILDQLLALIKKWQIPPGRVKLNITGGEPLVRKDLFQLLERISQSFGAAGHRWSLMTNGSLLDKEKLIKLKNFNIESAQVSIEGMKKNTEEIMGKGAFDKIVKAIKLLVKAGVPTRASFTLTKKNMNDVPSLVKLSERLKIDILGTRRLIPWGRGKGLQEYMLQPQELKEYYLKVKEINKKLKQKKKKLKVIIGCESAIFNEEILNDPLSDMKINFCGVTQGRALTIMANGDILPCRRLPIVVGNVLRDNLFDVWYSEPMKNLRNPNKLHSFCQKCSNFSNCFGGGRCLPYAYTGKIDLPDIQCWRAYRKLDEPLF